MGLTLEQGACAAGLSQRAVCILGMGAVSWSEVSIIGINALLASSCLSERFRLEYVYLHHAFHRYRPAISFKENKIRDPNIRYRHWTPDFHDGDGEL